MTGNFDDTMTCHNTALGLLKCVDWLPCFPSRQSSDHISDSYPEVGSVNGLTIWHMHDAAEGLERRLEATVVARTKHGEPQLLSQSIGPWKYLLFLCLPSDASMHRMIFR